MTGDIQARLSTSDAAESLRMESYVADCFRSRKWPAEQGVYFSDPKTQKVREIDVLSRHYLRRPVRHQGIGGPLINFSIICECKSLSGWNVLFQKGDREWYETRMMQHWSGYEDHIREIVERFAQEPRYRRCNLNQLYAYYVDRAYPDGMELAHLLHLSQPPIDLIATAFRPTKGGANEMRKADERDTLNPFWSAIQSVLSALTASELHSAERTKDFSFGPKPYAANDSVLVRDLAFHFDAELARRVFFHPIVFCKAKLFELSDKTSEVSSARLFVRSLDSGHRYVDVVNYDHAKDYIDKLFLT